jgi:ribosome-associated protein
MEALHKELQFRFARSGGSGGQHVNKVATKVELLFDVLQSQLLTDKQKQSIVERLGNRMTQDGVLQITSEASRSQLQNKNLAIKKFDQLIFNALKPVKTRAEVVAYTADKRKRLSEKRQNSEKKAARSLSRRASAIGMNGD